MEAFPNFERKLNNLKVLCNIINKLASGQFYIGSKNSDYTPFIWYFIDNVEKLFNIFDHLTKVKLPPFIEKFIKNELPSNYEYNYFKENPDEVIGHRSTCFNLEQINSILDIMNRHKATIFPEKELNQKKKRVTKNYGKIS